MAMRRWPWPFLLLLAGALLATARLVPAFTLWLWRDEKPPIMELPARPRLRRTA